MEKTQRYVINKPSVVAEVIDGELVAIQLETGCYYHANPTGSFIWTALEQGKSVAQVIQALASYAKVDIEKAAKDVTAFVGKLVQEALLRLSEDVNGLEVANGWEILAMEEYVEPTLKRHEDMKELLLLDPIHDIGEQAWPTHVV